MILNRFQLKATASNPPKKMSMLALRTKPVPNASIPAVEGTACLNTMEIHQKSYDLFCKTLSDTVCSCLKTPGLKVVMQNVSTIVDKTDRREVSRTECIEAGLTESRQVIAQCKHTTFTLFELPVMKNGVFIIKGKKKIIM